MQLCGSKNRIGWLRRAIEEDWQPTDGQLQAREAQAMIQTEEERKARWIWIKRRKELIEQEIRDWNKTPPEERIQGRLEFWLLGFKLKRLLGPGQEEIEAKKAELISELPKTEEEKRSYLASKYPLNPPEDFI